MNPELVNVDFSSVTPSANVVATPNTVLATPFRSQRNTDASPAKFSTPGSARGQNTVALQTPLRDKLNINPEDAVEGSETPLIQKQVLD